MEKLLKKRKIFSFRGNFCFLLFFFLVFFFCFSADAWEIKKYQMEINGIAEGGSIFLKQKNQNLKGIMWSHYRIKVKKEKNTYTAFLSYEIFPVYAFNKNAETPVFYTSLKDYRIFDISEKLFSEERAEILQNLNQCYYRRFYQSMEFGAGRQIISLGTAKGISPVDIFTGLKNFSLEDEEPFGVDSFWIKKYFPVKDTEVEIQTGMVMGKKKILKNGGSFVKGYYPSEKGDFKLIGLKAKDWYAMGFGAYLPVKKAGFWIDSGLFLKSSKIYFRNASGVEYLFFQKVYIFVEHYYNQAEEKILEITFQPPEKNYLIAGLKWNKDIFETSFFGGKSFDSEEYFFQIKEEISLGENLFLVAGGLGTNSQKFFFLKFKYYY